jgi:uncharacterized repeat protein (TIGR03803 family)
MSGNKFSNIMRLNSIYIKAIMLFTLFMVCNIQNSNAQYKKLVDFDGTGKGSYPQGSLTLSGSVMFGMTNNGGTNSRGIIFKVNTDGTGFTKLIDFDDADKGSGPTGSLTLSDSVLYGMTYSGGANANGVIFNVNTDGSGFKKLIDFDGSFGTKKGSYPEGSLTLSGTLLYGMTGQGGTDNEGVVFKINTDGSGFTKLFDFTITHNGSIFPESDLTLSGTILYGTTAQGGPNNRGTIFKLNTDGTGFTKLTEFNGDGNGSFPYCSLVLSGTALYGTSSEGGPNHSAGVLFKVDTITNAFEKLVYFDDSLHKGANPLGSLTLYGQTLYGMTVRGGAYHKGVIYKVNTDGTGFTKLLDFDGTNGSTPLGGFTLSGNILYGMTGTGGANNKGVVFRYIIDQSDGIDEIHRGFHIYPNPIMDQLIINTDDAQTIAKLELINLEGQIVKSLICNSAEVIVNVSNLTDGIYIIKAYDKTGKISIIKILKQ